MLCGQKYWLPKWCWNYSLVKSLVPSKIMQIPIPAMERKESGNHHYIHKYLCDRVRRSVLRKEIVKGTHNMPYFSKQIPSKIKWEKKEFGILYKIPTHSYRETGKHTRQHPKGNHISERFGRNLKLWLGQWKNWLTFKRTSAREDRAAQRQKGKMLSSLAVPALQRDMKSYSMEAAPPPKIVYHQA